MSDSGSALKLTPSGRLCLVGTVQSDRIVKAFAQGVGHGLLHLGTAEVSTALPAELRFFRDLARRYVTALCSHAELETLRGAISIPPPALSPLVDDAPFFPGVEHLTTDVLRRLWEATEDAFRSEITACDGSVQDYLRARSRVWSTVGRVCLHLAENKRDPDHPFAFLATYASALSGAGRVQHQPLGRALAAYASDRKALLKLLLPLQQATQHSALIAELVQTQDIYRPQRWSAAQAWRFLKELPALEASGLVVRVPTWWRSGKPPRPQVQVTIESSGILSLESMLRFSAALTLDGEPLTEAEIQALLAAQEGLVLLRGQWVELDPDALQRVLDHWEQAQAQGVSFAQAMRLLARADIHGELQEASLAVWSDVHAGPQLEALLAQLQDPQRLDEADPGDALTATLRPYQQKGVRWLWLLNQLGLGACLADDMGLGKTIQVLALLLLLRRRPRAAPSLLVVPTSLLSNWQEELRRFAPSLRVHIAHASSDPSLSTRSRAHFEAHEAIITSYGMVHRLKVLLDIDWGLVVLDEAQAIKNPATRRTRAVKSLRSRTRLILTGTPIENNLTDLWSLFDFINPGLLGSQRQFNTFTQSLEGHFGPLRRLVRPYILRRLKSDRSVITDLPDKTVLTAWCSLSRLQAALYTDTVRSLAQSLASTDGMARRGLVLASLVRLKQICNHPSQWLSDDHYRPSDSGKFQRLTALCEQIAARQEKVLVFTQFRQVIAPLALHLAEIFGQTGLTLHGGTPVSKRAERVAAFQREDGPPFFVLSLKAGGTGLNLTAAAHVIHFDRWWNPAVERQATDRAYRIGQHRNVLVHKFVCRGTLEERIDEMITAKARLADSILERSGSAALTELSNEELLAVVRLDLHQALEESA